MLDDEKLKIITKSRSFDDSQGMREYFYEIKRKIVLFDE
jgi:hypothetical protein